MEHVQDIKVLLRGALAHHQAIMQRAEDIDATQDLLRVMEQVNSQVAKQLEEVEWQALRWRRLEWVSIPALSRLEVLPYLDVGDNLSLNYALTNHESQEPFLLSYTKTMLPAFINMTYTNKKDFAALRWAMKKGVHLPGLKLVIEEEFGEDDDDDDDEGSDRALWWLLYNGKSDIATVYAMGNELSVVTRGYSSEHVNDCLRWAAGLGLKAVVEKLFGHEDADINKADEHGWTPLYAASGNGHLKVVQALLGKEGIDINKADEDGRTPLYIASCNGHLEVVQALLDKEGIDINKANDGGWTPLRFAMHFKRSDIVVALEAAVSLQPDEQSKRNRQRKCH